MRAGVATARQVQGKQLSYNNINDTDAAYECVAEFDPKRTAAVAIIKHANPCGVAEGASLVEAYRKALACDSTSAFGGIVALNRTLDAEAARAITEIFTEVIIAPDATDEAIKIVAAKKNLRLLLAGGLPDPRADGLTVKSVAGGLLVQSRDNATVDEMQLKTVTKRAPTAAELDDLRFAFRVAKHVKSNTIVYAKDRATVGIGAGQMSRVDAARIAARKAEDAAKELKLAAPLTKGSVVASDAFFPFPDGLLVAIEAGATAVIQPGGSVQRRRGDRGRRRARRGDGAHRHAAFPALMRHYTGAIRRPSGRWRERSRAVGWDRRATPAAPTAHLPFGEGKRLSHRQPFARSPSRLAATVSFDSVSPLPAIWWIAARMRSTSAWRGLTQASHRGLAGLAGLDHRRGEPPLGVADGIERAVERQPVEIIRHDDAARRRHHAVDAEIRLGGEVGRDDRGDRLLGAVGDQHDVGRRGDLRNVGDAARQRLRHAGIGQFLRARRPRRGRILRQRLVERVGQRRDALAIMLDHAGQALGQIGVAQEPDHAVEQQVLHGGVELELHLAGDLAVERVDLLVERRHVVAVAHRGEGEGDRRRRRAGLIGDPHHERRPAAVDHRVGKLRRDDLAPQPVLLQRVGEFLRDQLREIAAELAAEIGIVRHVGIEQIGVERELGVGQQHRQLRPRQRLLAADALGELHVVRQDIRPRGRARRAAPASASAAAGSRGPPARAARASDSASVCR